MLRTAVGFDLRASTMIYPIRNCFIIEVFALADQLCG